MNNTVDLCILTYNNEDIISKTLDNVSEILSSDVGIDLKVHVLDNGSADNTSGVIANYPFVTHHKLVKNRFFSGGANFLFDKCCADHVFFMSSDVTPRSDALSKLLEFARANPDAGIISCPSILPDGAVEQTVKRRYTPLMMHLIYGVPRMVRRFRDRVREHYYYYDEGFPFSEPREVEVIQDSFIYIRGELLRSGLRFDEAMRLYFTEDDICANVRNRGYKVYFFPGTQVGHLLQATTNQDGIGSRKIYMEDCLVYCSKYLGSLHRFLVKSNIQTAELLRRLIRP